MIITLRLTTEAKVEDFIQLTKLNLRVISSTRGLILHRDSYLWPLPSSSSPGSSSNTSNLNKEEVNALQEL